MAPAFPEEYQSREAYYDEWLEKHQASKNDLPDSLEARHDLLVGLREDAYETLCDSVYKAKGYSISGIPLPETLKRFDLFDDKALAILQLYGFSSELKN